MKNLFPCFLLSIALFACDGGKQNQTSESTDTTAVGQQPGVSLSEAWSTDTVFRTPESVLYDKDNDVLYVSNINGQDPSAKDGNGFISKLSTSGEVIELEWATGLDAPKGMGVSDGSLYVTDIDRLVVISLETGEITGTYPVEGASFLNDVAVGDDGTVYFSGSESGKVFQFQNGEVSPFMEESVPGPNGLFVENGQLLVLSNGNQVMKSIDLENLEIDSLVSYTGHGDGLVPAGNDDYIISNWEGEVYYLSAEKELTRILDTKNENINAADIDYIVDENLLLVPTFFDNRVVAYQLQTEEAI